MAESYLLEKLSKRDLDSAIDLAKIGLAGRCKASDYKNAGDIARKLGMKEKATELYERAIQIFEDEGQIHWAAGTAKLVGMTDRAIQIYEDVGELVDAAHIAEDAGMTEKARDLYERYAEELKKRGCLILADEIFQKVKAL